MGNKFNFTPEQEAVIKHDGGALLVSAAAGSGKTKVLVGRLLNRIEHGADIRSFLIITYTNAAAAELRGRILDGIHELLAEQPGNTHLRRQTMLCRAAQISTIHSFCIDILRENAHLVRLMPDFRVADENESELIKTEVLESVLMESYETIGESEGFRELVDTLSAGRDDRKLISMILEIHRRLQSKPFPKMWVDRCLTEFEMPGIVDAAQTVWGARLIEKAIKTTTYWRNEMARVREEIREFPAFDCAYGASFESIITDCDSFLSAMDKGWDEACRKSEIEMSNVKRISGFDEFKAVRKRCIDGMRKCTAVFKCASEDYIADMRSIAPAVRALLELVIKLDDAYLAEKRNRGIADFSDLEHQVLSLLIDRQTMEKTEVAKTISNRYREIMIDEYQDVNGVQEIIFNAISRDSTNMFMVGDVKQSIYRFRLADPSIFLDKYLRFSDTKVTGDDHSSSELLISEGRRIMLSKNFRSRPGVIDAVNYIFGKIMSKEFGEMDYTQTEALLADREADAGTGCAFEFNIIDMSGLEEDEDEESPAALEVEAQLVAGRIDRLVRSGYCVPDENGMPRPVKYSDIAILLRSVKSKAWQFAAALSRLGISADLPLEEGFLETPEISAALSIISVVDNPMQDIPLVAAMRSLAYGFSADELAMIRAQAQSLDFYSALLKASETNEKCASFINDIKKMREIAPDMTADRFIWHMYSATGLLAGAGALPDGTKRRGNLVMLSEYARRYEQSGYKGLFGFLTYIRSLQHRGAEPAQASAGESSTSHNADAVKIMSIHKSKGLEFPVVILADTAKRFNKRDLSNPIVFHTDLGVGVKYIDRQRKIEYPTLSRLAIQSKLMSEMMAEELRLLYVAMTRAREKLIITATLKNAEKELEKMPVKSSGKPALQILEESGSMAKWLMIALTEDIRRQLDIGEVTTEDVGEIKFIDAAFILGDKIYSNDFDGSEDQKTTDNSHNSNDLVDNKLSLSCSATEDVDAYIEKLHERFSYVYPFPKAPDLPSKLTATGLKGRHATGDGDNEAEKAAYLGYENQTGSHTVRLKTFRRAQFAEKEKGLTAAERGTILHLVMQFVDYNKCSSQMGIKEEILNLVKSGVLTAEQSDIIETARVEAFFKSDIGERLLTAESVTREFRFSLLSPAEEFYSDGGEDKVLLQGMVDCFFEENGELTVLDFKTDFVTSETIEEKKNHYTPQLAIYSQALERITGKHVKERIIYFFSVDSGYAV